MIRFRPAPLALALSLAGGCVGGQSGDEGLGNNDPPGPEITTAMVPERCEGEADSPGARPRSGHCIEQIVDAETPMYRCDCAERSGDIEAATCREALREQCGLEYVEPRVPDAGDCLEEPTDPDDDAGACR